MVHMRPRSRASVIVRTLNSAATLGAALDSLGAQTVVPEIVVVDSGSGDATIEIAEHRADAIVRVAAGEFTYGRALNVGAEAATAPIHFALSSHCVVPRPDWIERSLAHYRAPEVAGTNGQMTRPDGSPLREPFRLRRDTPLRDPFWGFSNHASSWRADVWQGEPFDEGLISAEDFEWSDRVRAAGWTLVFDPTLLVPGHHLEEEGALALFRRSRRELEGIASFRAVEPPTLRETVSAWWSWHPGGARRLRQRLSPYRTARLAGRYAGARRLRRPVEPFTHPGRLWAPQPVGALPVTVIIPAYERASTIERAVASALGQHPRAPAEVLVVDDCSSDATAELAARAGARVVQHAVNQGAGAARNTALAHASQPWVALLDSDDEWLPHHLTGLWPHRAGHVLVAAAALRCVPGGGRRYLGPAEPTGHPLRSPADVAVRSLVVASGTLLRRDAVHAAGGFRALHGVEDIDLWLRLLEHGTGWVAPRPSVLYHVHEAQISGDDAGLQARRRRVLEEYADRPWFEPRLLRAWDAIMAWDSARSAQRAGDIRTALLRLKPIVRDAAGRRALAVELRERHASRRRTSQFTDAGIPTLAVADPRAARSAPLNGYVLTALHGRSRATRYVELARRPAAALLATGWPEAALARGLGMHAVRLSRRGGPS